MSLSYSHGREFVEQARVVLETTDVRAFIRFLSHHWPPDALEQLLECGHEDAVKTALTSLALVGEMRHCAAIAALLHDDDGATAGLAEHALWSVWFRAGGPLANCRLSAAVRLINENHLTEATQLLGEALACTPDFAEAYNQLAMIEFLRGNYQEALTHCLATLRLNPWHFGAMAGLGHCHAALGDFEAANETYQRALHLNPRMDGLRQAIRHLRAAARCGQGAA